ncbi:MAG: Tol-Pal system protein TolB [Campylobacterota bacterium]|nr:Tol-Pal system protein TolB [Campylobacterota bacterium]
MKYILMLLFSIHLFAVDATLKIETDVEQRSRIAIVDSSTVANPKFFNILLSDFKISGHFLSDSKRHDGEWNSNFIDPILKSKEYIVKYLLDERSGSKLNIRLLKASNGDKIFQKSYSIPSKSKMPFLAHKAVSDINDVLKYPSISWINRYVVFSRYTASRKSEIILADYTFNYTKAIIRGGLNLFPKWADEKQKSFYYTSYAGLYPTLYKINIYTGAKKKIVSSEGMLVCTDVSKDGTKLLLTMAPHGQPDIYELNVVSKGKIRVTKFNGIDVSGKYSDNENSLFFVSNRLGYANVFKKPLHSAAVSQVVHHGKNNNACDTHGEKMVYSSRESQKSFGNNKFNLYLTSTNGSDTRPLTTTGTNQFPRFSADGSVVLFIKHSEYGSSIGYTNLQSLQSLLFPLGEKKIQSIDW